MNIILVALLLVSVGWDVAAAKPSEGMIQPAFSEVWLNGTREWLRACRVTQSDRVAYAERTHQFVDQEPDLYTTVWFAQYVSLLPLSMSETQKQHIVQWIDTLRQEDGSYRDPASRFPPLYVTLLAVLAHQSLIRNSGELASLTHYLSSLKRWDGLFLAELSDTTESHEQMKKASLAATHLALQLYDLIDIEPSHNKELRERLIKLSSDRSRFGVTSAESILKDGGLVLDALRMLAVPPGSLPELRMLREWSQHWIRQLISNDFAGDILTMTQLDRMLAIGRYLGVDIPRLDVVIRNLKRIQLPNGGFGATPGSPRLEPQATSLAIKLFRHAEQTYPRQHELVRTLEAHWVEKGWRQVINRPPDPRATYFATGISRALGFPLPQQGLLQYIQAGYEESFGNADQRQQIRLLYYLARVEQLLGEEAGVISRFQDPVKQAVEGFINGTIPYDIETLALVTVMSKLGNIKLSSAFSSNICRYIQEHQKQDGGFGAEGDLSNVQSTFYALTIAKHLNSCAVDLAPALSWLQALQVEDGGFKRTTRYPFSDMDSTFFAMMGLSMHGKFPVRPHGVRSFIMRSLHEPFGIGFIPADSPWMSQFSGTPTNLKLTYEALAVLRSLDRARDLPVKWILPP